MWTSVAHSALAGGEGLQKVYVMVSDHSLLNGAQRGLSIGSHSYRIVKHLASPKAQLDCQAHGPPGCGHQPAGTSHPCVRPTGLGLIMPALCCAFEATGTLKSVSWQEEKSSKEPLSFPGLGSIQHPEALVYSSVPSIPLLHKDNYPAVSTQNSETTSPVFLSKQRLNPEPFKPG